MGEGFQGCDRKEIELNVSLLVAASIKGIVTFSLRFRPLHQYQLLTPGNVTRVVRKIPTVENG